MKNGSIKPVIFRASAWSSWLFTFQYNFDEINDELKATSFSQLILPS